MDFGLSLEASEDLFHLSPVVHEVSNTIEVAVAHKSYGEGLEHVHVGLILMSEDFTDSYPVRKFSFKKKDSFRRITDGQLVTQNNAASFDIKPAYSIIEGASLAEFREILVEMLIDSREVLLLNQKKFPAFDVNALYEDIKASLTA